MSSLNERVVLNVLDANLNLESETITVCGMSKENLDVDLRTLDRLLFAVTCCHKLECPKEAG